MKAKKSKNIFIFAVVLVAILAVLGGVGVYYAVSPNIEGTPTNLSVIIIDDTTESSQNTEDDGSGYYLYADFQAKYEYCFKIEQKITNAWVEIDNVKSSTNILSLAEQNIFLSSGSEFRFSVAFCNENGATGEFTDTIEWTSTLSLAKTTVTFENNVLSWDAVNFCESYTLYVTLPSGTTTYYSTRQTYYDFSTFTAGTYTAYVIANASGYTGSTSALYIFEVT